MTSVLVYSDGELSTMVVGELIMDFVMSYKYQKQRSQSTLNI